MRALTIVEKRLQGCDFAGASSQGCDFAGASSSIRPRRKNQMVNVMKITEIRQKSYLQSRFSQETRVGLLPASIGMRVPSTR